MNFGQELTGSSFFGYYSTKILAKLNIDGGFWTGVTGFCVFFTTFPGLYLVNKSGRLTVLLSSFICIILSFYGMAVSFYMQWSYIC